MKYKITTNVPERILSQLNMHDLILDANNKQLVFKYDKSKKSKCKIDIEQIYTNGEITLKKDKNIDVIIDVSKAEYMKNFVMKCLRYNNTIARTSPQNISKDISLMYNNMSTEQKINIIFNKIKSVLNIISDSFFMKIDIMEMTQFRVNYFYNNKFGFLLCTKNDSNGFLIHKIVSQLMENVSENLV